MINGRKGRRKFNLARRRQIEREAANKGVNVLDRVAMTKFENERFAQFCNGLRDRLKCGCAGPGKQVSITGVDVV